MNNNTQPPEGDSKPSNGNGHTNNGNGHHGNGPQKARSNLVQWLRHRVVRKGSEQSLKSELEEIIQVREEEGSTMPEENTIIRNVLKFSDSRVTDVMTPRLDICAVSADISLRDLKIVFTDNEHTRIPVFRENLDDVIGFVHIKDLIQFWNEIKPFDIQNVLREVLFVPSAMKLQTLLIKMQVERTHMAIVVDEYGGTDGLVTIEDIVEEIVGEIDDEHDDENVKDIIKVADNVFEVSARVEIKDLESQLNIKVYTDNEGEDFDTIGGLIFTSLGKVPKIGEQLRHKSGLTFKIIDADKRRIKRVKIIFTPVHTS